MKTINNLSFLSTDYLQQLANLLHKEGISTELLLAGTQLNPSALEASVDGIQKINPTQYQQIVSNALTLSRDPLLGSRHGQQMSMTSHGFLGLAAMASSTLGDAISLVIRFARTRTLMAELKFHKDGDTVSIDVERLAALPETFEFIVENVLSTLVTVTRFLNGGETNIPAIVKFNFGARVDKRHYEELLGVPVLFEQEKNQLCFPQYLLEMPVSGANESTRLQAEKACAEQLNKIQFGQDRASQVRKQLEQLSAYPPLEVMAEMLSISARSLNRHLAELNTSYQAILDDHKKKQAIYYLLHSDEQIEHIAYRLDYNDPSNFGRAFKRWTEMSPRAYRKQFRPKI